MRKRKVQKYGNADVIRLKPHDREDLGLEYGDLVDIDKIKKQNANIDSECACDMSNLDKMDAEEDAFGGGEGMIMRFGNYRVESDGSIFDCLLSEIIVSDKRELEDLKKAIVESENRLIEMMQKREAKNE